MPENLTTDELNALLVITSNAPIKGSDAPFIVHLMGKLDRLLEAAKAPPTEPQNDKAV